LDTCFVIQEADIDIDGYDYFVLDELLSAFRPAIICAEINEVIPPPIKFTVKWHPSYVWGENHFFGQSICQLNLLCEKYDYALVELHQIIRAEVAPRFIYGGKARANSFAVKLFLV